MYYKHVRNLMKGNNMKISSIFKYIFIIFAIGIIAYAGYKIYDRQKKETADNQQNNEVTVEESIIKDIRLSITNFDSINPLITQNKDIINIDTLVFEPLFMMTKDYQLQPCLAKECSKTGDNIYVVKIASNVSWHDGTPFTAKDVQFTIETIKNGNSVYKYNVDHISGVEVVDATTIKLTLDVDIPFFEYNLIFPIMPSYYYYGEEFYTSTKIPIGTGRYKIVNISTNNITLSKNEKWKSSTGIKEIKIDNIKINLYSSMGEAYNSFKMGNIDILNTSNPNFQEYIGTIGFNKTDYPGRQFDFLSFNCEDQIMQDKAVRQAISYAIDKSNIVSSIYNNNKIVSEYPLDYGSFLYTANNASSGYNPEHAKKVLEEGGWTYINNRWKKNIDGNTKTLKLKIAVCEDSTSRVSVAELIEKQLEDIGIDVTIIKVSNSQYNKYIDDKDYQILLTGVYTSYSPDLTYYFAQGNISNYNSDEMLELMQKAKIMKESTQLKEIYQKIYNLYKEDVPFIGLYRDKNMAISSQSLIGSLEPNNYTTFYGMEEWYRK